jgi:hypothetical protein
LSRAGRSRPATPPRRSSVKPTTATKETTREVLRCHAARCADRPWSPSASGYTRSPSAPAAARAGSKTANSSGRSTRSKNPRCWPKDPHPWPTADPGQQAPTTALTRRALTAHTGQLRPRRTHMAIHYPSRAAWLQQRPADRDHQRPTRHLRVVLPATSRWIQPPVRPAPAAAAVPQRRGGHRPLARRCPGQTTLRGRRRAKPSASRPDDLGDGQNDLDRAAGRSHSS